MWHFFFFYCPLGFEFENAKYFNPVLPLGGKEIKGEDVVERIVEA